MLIRRWMGSCALAAGALVGGMALAAEEPVSTQDDHAQATADRPLTEKKADETPQGADLLLKADETIGLDVRNKQNEEIGEVEDLIVDAKNGTVTHVIVSSGGFLGIGEKHLPIPLSAAHFGEEKGESEEWLMVVDLAKNDADMAPSLEDNTLARLEDDEWVGKLNEFYKVNATADVADAQAGDLLRCSELTGMSVRNGASDDELGEIHDIVFAAKDGKIRYVATEFGGVLDMGDELFALPWNTFAFTHSTEGMDETYASLTVDVNQELLDEMEGFNEDRWPQQADSRWAEGSHPSTRSAARPQDEVIE